MDYYLVFINCCDYHVEKVKKSARDLIYLQTKQEKKGLTWPGEQEEEKERKEQPSQEETWKDPENRNPS